MSTCTVFVGNISTQADENFIRRLFAAYGSVKSATMHSDPQHHYRYALVEYAHVDDADSAIASLHLRYCMAPGVPIICLYDKSSAVVSEYGREVGAAYREAIQERRDPLPLPLETFDSHQSRRAVVAAPSTDLRPPGPVPGASLPFRGPMLPPGVTDGHPPAPTGAQPMGSMKPWSVG